MTLNIISVKVERASDPSEDCKNKMVEGLEDEPFEYVLVVGLNENVLLDGASMSLIGCDKHSAVIDMIAGTFDRRADKLYEADFLIRKRHKVGNYKVRLNQAETDCENADLYVCIVKNSE